MYQRVRPGARAMPILLCRAVLIHPGFPSTTAEIEALPVAERNSLAAQLKDKGNKLYSKKEFQKAVDV